MQQTRLVLDKQDGSEQNCYLITLKGENVLPRWWVVGEISESISLPLRTLVLLVGTDWLTGLPE